MFFVALLLKQCREYNALETENRNLNEYKKDAKRYKAENGKLIEFNQALKVENNTLLSSNSDLAEQLENLKIKKPSSITNIVSNTIIDSVLIPFPKDVNFCSDTFQANFAYNDSIWILISGNVTAKGVFIEQIFVQNESLVVIGVKNNGLFKRNEYIVAVDNTNPYVVTTQMEGYTITPKPKFHDRSWFKVGLFGVGFVLGTLLK